VRKDSGMREAIYASFMLPHGHTVKCTT